MTDKDIGVVKSALDALRAAGDTGLKKEDVVALIDGDWWDAWDSGDEVPVYYWQKEV